MKGGGGAEGGAYVLSMMLWVSRSGVAIHGFCEGETRRCWELALPTGLPLLEQVSLAPDTYTAAYAPEADSIIVPS